MVYYAEEDDKWVEYNEYEEYQEPYNDEWEEQPVEAQDTHVRGLVNKALIKALTPLTKTLKSSGKRKTRSSCKYTSTIQASAEVLINMAKNVLLDHGSLAGRDTKGESSPATLDTTDSDDESVQPKKKVKKTKHVFYDAQEDVTPKNLLFNPQNLIHPRSTEWVPCVEVAHYVQNNLRQGFESQVRVTLHSECPRPSLGKVADTPELDPNMATFMRKFTKDPKKGLDRIWKGCQDMMLDVTGPLTKILDVAVTAKDKGVPLDSSDIMEWAQHAMCFLGNANVALSTERRRSFLMRIDPQLAEMATTEPGSLANGMLFGDDFVKKMGKYVATFSALDKLRPTSNAFFIQVFLTGPAGTEVEGPADVVIRPLEMQNNGAEEVPKDQSSTRPATEVTGVVDNVEVTEASSSSLEIPPIQVPILHYGDHMMGRSYCAVPSQMGGPDSRPMDQSDSSGFSYRVLCNSHTIGDSQTTKFFPCRDEFHRRGSSVVT
ncbi:uncharacterized protein LOC144755327 [Lissotriton helveticus]